MIDMVVVRIRPNGMYYEVSKEDGNVSVTLAYRASWIKLNRACAIWSYNDGEVVMLFGDEIEVSYKWITNNLIIDIH